MRWAWDRNKNRLNRDKHGLSFETAQLVFSDPLAVSRPDPSSDEERWQTIGMIAQVVLFVVHTLPALDSESGDGVGRIISARKATPQERKAYEEGEF
jgi:uncharacterized DUF497 family protein